MKKNYFKPEVVSVNVVVEAMIATSNGRPEEGGSIGGGSLPPIPANERRGEWGNVWGGGGSN